MLRLIVGAFLIFSFQISLLAQESIEYFLPADVSYNEDITTPEDFLGYQVGEWHVRHDQLAAYMELLAEESDRVSIKTIARTYEHRTALVLTITSTENHTNLDDIKAERVKLRNPELSDQVDISTMPSVAYMGYSVHGNEPSGSNASLLVAYYLAAAEGEYVENLLEHVVVLLDPSLNPDGLNRFAHWANTHKSKNLVADPQTREHNEYWPSGRTNHYWFDLNRDWLLVQHPTSQGRVKVFQEWVPNFLTDHHEMGTNSTFFFQPGIPSRTNPITPQENQDLTKEMATYHAEEFDSKQALYYSEESFDDFYYGKGSTYPDANGSIGVLFEQASSRGHLQESIHGDLSFPFTIRNQVLASMSTLKAALEMREKVNDYQRRFFKESLKEAKDSRIKAYVFGEDSDRAKTRHFLEILNHHNVDVYNLGKDVSHNGNQYSAGSSFVVPVEQPKYRLIRGMFETMTEFNDSLFYDVSSWTLPLAFNLTYDELRGRNFSSNMLGEKLQEVPELKGKLVGGKSDYAYLFEVNEYYAHRALERLLEAGVSVKIAGKTFSMNVNGTQKAFDYGTALIVLGTQTKNSEKIHSLIKEITQKDGIDVYSVSTGLTPAGMDLGSGSFELIKEPQVAIITGESASSYEAGEVWHLLDQRFDMELTMLEDIDMNRHDLDRYTTLIMVNGSYRNVSESGVEKIKTWVRDGGNLIVTKYAVSWAERNKLLDVSFVEDKSDTTQHHYTYASRSNRSGAQRIGGSIFEANIDVTHPLGYGFKNTQLPLFRNSTLFLNQRNNPYANPVVYTKKPLLSGYVSDQNLKKLSRSAAVVVNSQGSGRVIAFTDNPNFRAFWYGTNKLFMNAIFFGDMISGSSAR
jgi:hypothetical protein